jgi:hypothetical protein
MLLEFAPKFTLHMLCNYGCNFIARYYYILKSRVLRRPTKTFSEIIKLLIIKILENLPRYFLCLLAQEKYN